MDRHGRKSKFAARQGHSQTVNTRDMNERIKREHMAPQALGRVDPTEPFKRFNSFLRDVFLVAPVRHEGHTRRRRTLLKQKTHEMTARRAKDRRRR